MTNTDKFKHQVEDIKGTAKEDVGGATGDEQLEAEGRDDRAKAKAKQAGESLKDAASDAADSLKKKFD